MNLKQISLALATLGTGVSLAACKKNKDATEVPGASGRGGEGGCGGKAKKESGCGSKAKKESGCGADKGEDAGTAGEGGCGSQAKAKKQRGGLEDESQNRGTTLSAQGPEPRAAEATEREEEDEKPVGPTDAKVEAMSDSAPLQAVDSVKPRKKRRRRRRRKSKKRRRAASEEVCGEGTCG